MNDLDLVIFDMAGKTIVDAGQVPETFSTALGVYGIGAHKKDHLEKAPHTHLIPSVAVLPDLWK